MEEKGISDIGHWSLTTPNWWEKNIYPRNILRLPVPSFTFSARSLEDNKVFDVAEGIQVICEGLVYRLPRSRFRALEPYNYGNGRNYRCPKSQFNYILDPRQGVMF